MYKLWKLSYVLVALKKLINAKYAKINLMSYVNKSDIEHYVDNSYRNSI